MPGVSFLRKTNGRLPIQVPLIILKTVLAGLKTVLAGDYRRHAISDCCREFAAKPGRDNPGTEQLFSVREQAPATTCLLNLPFS